MKITLVSILIALFGFLNLPKNVWHDCDHTHHESHSIDTEDTKLFFGNDECHICDLEFFQEYRLPTNVALCEQQFVLAKSVCINNNCITKEYRVQETRGSPVEIS